MLEPAFPRRCPAHPLHVEPLKRLDNDGHATSLNVEFLSSRSTVWGRDAQLINPVYWSVRSPGSSKEKWPPVLDYPNQGPL